MLHPTPGGYARVFRAWGWRGVRHRGVERAEGGRAGRGMGGRAEGQFVHFSPGSAASPRLLLKGGSDIDD
jgi:hypothetical protein